MMGELRRFHSEIDALAALLEKLLKVINHSDPSAKNMRVILYEKYKGRLSMLAEELKPMMSWSTLNGYLNDLLTDNSLTVAKASTEIVVKKLIKDFENEFVVRHKLAEFSSPDPIDLKQRERIKKIRKQIRNNRRYHSNSFQGTDIIEMMQHKVQQKTAKRSLDKLVKAFNKIDLSNNEN